MTVVILMIASYSITHMNYFKYIYIYIAKNKPPTTEMLGRDITCIKVFIMLANCALERPDWLTLSPPVYRTPSDVPCFPSQAPYTPQPNEVFLRKIRCLQLSNLIFPLLSHPFPCGIRISGPCVFKQVEKAVGCIIAFGETIDVHVQFFLLHFLLFNQAVLTGGEFSKHQMKCYFMINNS